MPVTTKSVFSSHVSTVSYDSERRELAVTWDSGKTSVYEGVPADVAHGAMNAWSVGSYLTENVKSNFPHRYA